MVAAAAAGSAVIAGGAGSRGRLRSSGTTAQPTTAGAEAVLLPLWQSTCRQQLTMHQQQLRMAQRLSATAIPAVVAAATGAEAEPDGPAAAAGSDPPPLPGHPQPAASQALPSRLQQEVELLVALDVEYTHLRLAPGGHHVSLPAEVCAVDAQGRVLLYEHCNPLQDSCPQQRGWRHVGGHPPALWLHAPPLVEVRQQLAELLHGRVLVGHHLRKDLAALGMTHPAEQTRDTLQYRELQRRRGSGRKLRDLSAEKLGRSIQAPGRRHSPREDAQAAMDLYLQNVHFEEQYMQYDDLVERHLAEIMAGSTHSMDSADGAEADGLGSSGGGAASVDDGGGASGGADCQQ